MFPKFFKNLQESAFARGFQLFKKRLRYRCPPENFTKFLRTFILWKICKQLLLKIIFLTDVLLIKSSLIYWQFYPINVFLEIYTPFIHNQKYRTYILLLWSCRNILGRNILWQKLSVFFNFLMFRHFFVKFKKSGKLLI